MKKFVCSVCGYVHTADELAADFACPVCKVPASKFVEQKGEMKLAAEHEFGIYETTVANNPDISDADKAYIKEQLFANFNGECSEVGMYLCMARIAHREGYPEIGLYWEKAAYEEAEHAAKFVVTFTLLKSWLRISAAPSAMSLLPSLRSSPVR